MFLSRQEIKDRLHELIPVLNDRNEENIKEANLDLRVGDEVYVSGHEMPIRLTDEDPYVVLHPGEFALVKTFEKLKMPANLVGLISMRYSYKMKGLVNISGFHVDPCFEGPIFFAVQNVGPNDVRLRYKDEVFMIMWATLSSPVQTTKEEQKHRRGKNRITLEQMTALGGGGITIGKLEKQISSLETSVRIYGALAAAALVGILILVLRQLFTKGG